MTKVLKLYVLLQEEENGELGMLLQILWCKFLLEH